MELDPDMGGVSAGSIMIQPILRLRVLRRHEQIYMPKYAATRFVEYEIAQGLIRCNPTSLLPDRVPGRRSHATDNDISHLSFGMAADDMHDFCRTHTLPLNHSCHGDPSRLNMRVISGQLITVISLNINLEVLNVPLSL